MYKRQDFPCADPIIDALHKRIDRKIFGYTVYNNPIYKEAVTGWYKRRHGWDVKAEDIFFSPGVVPAICYLIQALSEEGDGIVIQRPVYYPFTNSILGNGRKVVNNPLIYQDGRYTMDYEDLDKKMACLLYTSPTRRRGGRAGPPARGGWPRRAPAPAPPGGPRPPGCLWASRSG